ncbi:MAG: ABC transporter substrate-binding protein [Deltaproteobacteria bacterium]|nr:ABC transporter substrate-binding protein [Deltaproteobacteria bacterium]MBW2051251.1 ABC transporter substrate-binding protein [Deltaproteobacteria bacterium]MBW2140319.1 ABC transporter substrate-binding protein [Deltaproteobacteria bacterium]MBW2323553.1 ABC transporter substrate-binding protein [Deltaproteobacteria bacterium]
MKKRGLLGLTLTGALVLLVAVSLTIPVWAASKAEPWAVWDYSKEKPVRGGYYRTAGARDVGLLNPNHWPVNDWLVINFFFEKFLITDGNYRPVPWMVESWSYPDSLTCIMKLKKGITYHDGAKFNAEAVKYQIDWIKDKKNGAWSRAWIEPIKGVEVVDEYTVKWTFKRQWAAFLGIIANVPGYAISPNALKGDVLLTQASKAVKKAAKLKAKAAKGEKEKKAYEKAQALADKLAAQAKGLKKTDVMPVGTGKWILEERSPGNFIKVKRNPNWWFGKSIGHPDMPYYDGRLQTIIPDPSVQLANLRSGKIDSMTLSKSQYQQVAKDENLKAYIGPVNHVRAMRFNHKSGPCKDIRVRKAISHAIDRRALVVGTEFGMGRVASVMYPDDHWAHNPNLKPVKYDPELSKKLLAEAGYPNGLTVKGYMLNNPTVMNWTEAIKNMLDRVNINWEVESLDSVAISDRMKNLEYDFGGGGWTWIYDPDLMATGLYHPDGGFNYGRSNNEKAIELIIAGRKEVDLIKRQKIYWELEKVLYENYEDAWLWWEMWPSAYSKNVAGYNHKMSVRHKEIWSWSHPTWFRDGKP